MKITPREAAERLSEQIGREIDLSTIRNWLKDKRLPFIKVGGRIFIDIQDLETCIEKK